MKKRLLLILLGLAFATAAFGTPKSKSTLQTEIGTSFPSGCTGCITATVMQNTFSDFLASWQQYASVNTQAGTSYTVQASDYGQLITFNNGSPVAVTLPQANGTFSTFNSYFTNFGGGVVTITPTSSTINGGASVALSTNQSAWVVSDGMNYSALLFTVNNASVPSGTPTNTLNTQTSNYTIQSSDCGKTVQAGTGSTGYFKITLPAVGGFSATCVVTIKNADTGRGKALSGFPADIPLLPASSPSIAMLWPLQVIQVGIVNGAWATLQNPGMWNLPTSQTIFVDTVSGKDDGTTDGFASNSAFKNFDHAYSVVQQSWCERNQYNVTANVVQTTNTTTTGWYFNGPLCNPPITSATYGVTENSLLVPFVIAGAGIGTTTISSSSGIALFALRGGASVRFTAMTAQSTGAGSFIIQSYNSQGFCDLINFKGDSNTVGIYSLFFGSYVQCAGAITISTNFKYFISVEDMGGFNWHGSLTLTGTPAWAFTFLQVDWLSHANISLSSVSGSATGSRWTAITNGYINTNGSGCDAGSAPLPGSVNGTANTGGGCSN